MNTSELQCCIKCDFILRGRVSVCVADHLPDTLNSLPQSFIVNTDTYSRPGTHWCAVYIDQNGNGEFFDSFGNQPDHYGYFFIRFLRKHCGESITVNTKAIQSDFSRLCGMFCVFYLHQRFHHVPAINILSMFSPSNKSLNDVFLHQNILRIFQNCLKDDCLQTCKPLVKLSLF